MRKLSVELDERTADALEAERSVLGFDTREAYVRWIVEHRATLDDEPNRERALFEERIAELERRLEELTSAASTAGSEDARTEPEPVAVAPAGGSARPAGESTQATITDASGGDSNGLMASTDGGWTQAEGGTVTASGRADLAEVGITSMNLTPERVERVRDDRLADDAGDLGTVEYDRLDELSRRAVTKTRKQLDRTVETGLEYRSSPTLSADDGCRPGEDVVDLDALDVPGRSAEVIAQRRELIGHAVAFLRDDGPARKGDFVEALFADQPAGYASADGWWNCIKEAFKALDIVDGGDGSRVWAFDE